MLINSVKLLVRFLPVHTIVVFTLVGLLLYYVLKAQKAKTVFLAFWGFIFVCLYGHPSFAFLTLMLTVLVYLVAKSFVKMKNGFGKKSLLFWELFFISECFFYLNIRF